MRSPPPPTDEQGQQRAAETMQRIRLASLVAGNGWLGAKPAERAAEASGAAEEAVRRALDAGQSGIDLPVVSGRFERHDDFAPGVAADEEQESDTLGKVDQSSGMYV